MNPKMSRASSVFLDTAYAIALISPTDQFHVQAELLSYELEASATPIVTTRAVLIEIGNALSSKRLRHIGVRLLTTLEADLNVKLSLYQKTCISELSGSIAHDKTKNGDWWTAFPS